jgi:L-threonylcarbamoyladenylate synthase
MEIQPINRKNPEKTIVRHAADIVKRGGVVVFPSDTCYGVASNPYNKEAIRRLFNIKQRKYTKAVSCIFGNIGEVAQWTNLTNRDRVILEKNLPGPFTFLLRPSEKYPLKSECVGVRIPDSVFTSVFSATLKIPFTATSANLAGRRPTYSLAEILKQFKNQKHQPDLVLDAGELPRLPPSTVVNLTKKAPVIIRKGIVLPLLV